jgi:hypothetical protein
VSSSLSSFLSLNADGDDIVCVDSYVTEENKTIIIPLLMSISPAFNK